MFSRLRADSLGCESLGPDALCMSPPRSPPAPPPLRELPSYHLTSAITRKSASSQPNLMFFRMTICQPVPLKTSGRYGVGDLAPSGGSRHQQQLLLFILNTFLNCVNGADNDYSWLRTGGHAEDGELDRLVPICLWRICNSKWRRCERQPVEAR